MTVAVVVGGMGSLVGAVVGGFVIGIIVTMLQAYLPPDLSAFRDAFAFVILSCSCDPPAWCPRAPRSNASDRRTAPMRDLVSRHQTPTILVAAIVALALLGVLAGKETIEVTLTEMFIRLIVVVGLSVFIGNSGIISFGHVGFMRIGAYAPAWATAEPSFK
ncbi:hypothetical protein [Aureimonas pseudogalii]|uniref:ABC-type branched-subunit amino acid transport system permease subunit n=1 Tax=Aureimonas pseudogalii TaxID=1744844 RepID=A0A7W6H638_9HYPH|nr:hypothetical protein [Aureimonas pseudogalii]MBB3999241.1 ABC-type branched-subunit amino acid transport system permease subunit [Aureimonas pseudogalii]